MKKYCLLYAFMLFIFACDDRSDNAGRLSLSTFKSPSADSASEPYLFTADNGDVFFSWITKNRNNGSLQFSSLTDVGWGAPGTIASGTNWFLNWADYPVIASNGKGALMAHFLQKSDSGKYTYNVMITNSADNGHTWTKPSILHDDATLSEHGFVSIVPYNDEFVVSWLDGRNSVPEHSGSHDGHHGQMTLRAALVDIDGHKISDDLIDERVCDCCQTRLAVTANGPVLVYRDRSENEVRDISIVRWTGKDWTAPKNLFADNWVIDGCPVNGPSIDAINNTVAVAWFSTTEKKGRVSFMFSNDAGVTFGDTVRIDEGKPVGRADVLLIDNSTAMVCWMELNAIRAVRVHSDGSKDPSVLISSTSGSRSAGFPQMTRFGNKVIFAWTDDKLKQIKMATLSPI